MLINPPSEPKENAKWVIFSTLFSRVHEKQRKEGRFYALWADIDEAENLTFDNIIQQVGSFLPSFFAYTSSSATETKQKSRIIVHLTTPINGKRFIRFQKILNDKLEKLNITPDRATQRAGQLCYLPNKGEYYKHHIKDGIGLSPESWAGEEQYEINHEQEEEKQRIERKEQSRLNALKYIGSGKISPIDAFNDAHSLPYVLESYGYLKKGDRWLSPNSQSKNPGVSISHDGKKWFSAHASDYDIGAKSENGRFGSAFDLFVHYEHGGDVKKSCHTIAEMYNMNNEIYDFNEIFGKYIEPKTEAEPKESFIYIPTWDNCPPEAEVLLKLNNTPVLHRQNMCMLTAGAGQGKTAAVHASLTTLISEDNETLGLSAFGKGATILDTEHDARLFNVLWQRFMARCGFIKHVPCPENIKWKNIRAVENLKDRLSILWDEFTICKGLLIIDGIGDFVSDPNNSDECTALVYKLSSEAQRNDIGVLLTLHNNPVVANEKARGILGSEMWRKAESTLIVKKEKNSDVVRITTEYSLGKNRQDSDQLSAFFKWDNFLKRHMPCEEPTEDDKINKNNEQKQKILIKFKDNLTYSQLTALIVETIGVKERQAKSKIKQLIEEDLIEKLDNNTYRQKIKVDWYD